MRGFTGLGLACLTAASAAHAADCTGVSQANNTTLTSVIVASGLTGRPLFVTTPPGDTSRIFIVEQNGFIRIHNRGVIGSTLYMDIDARVDSSSDEEGLLGLAFDPDFATRVQPVPGSGPGMDDSGRRWDGANLQAFEGTYGDYVVAKVGKVFPDLKQSVSDR